MNTKLPCCVISDICVPNILYIISAYIFNTICFFIGATHFRIMIHVIIINVMLIGMYELVNSTTKIKVGGMVL